MRKAKGKRDRGFAAKKRGGVEINHKRRSMVRAMPKGKQGLIMERTLTLAIDRPTFIGLTWDSKLKGFVLSWAASTELANVLWIKFITISFRWLPIRVYKAFMYKEAK